MPSGTGRAPDIKISALITPHGMYFQSFLNSSSFSPSLFLSRKVVVGDVQEDLWRGREEEEIC